MNHRVAICIIVFLVHTEIFLPYISACLSHVTPTWLCDILHFSSGSTSPTGGTRVADVSRRFDSQLETSCDGVYVGSACTTTTLLLLFLLSSLYTHRKMPQGHHNLRHQRNELGYQHTLVSPVMLYLRMSACKVDVMFRIAEFASYFNVPIWSVQAWV